MTRFLSSLALLIIFGFACLTTSVTWSDEGAGTSAVSDLERSVLKSSAAFVEAYNAADANALAKLFTEQGEFIDVERIVYHGRDAIAAEFGASFKAVPGREISVRVESIRQVARTVALEDGHVTVTRDNGPAYVSRYTAVHVFEQDKWQIASLRDLSTKPLTTGENLLALQWLIGDWISESADGVVEHSFYWSENGNFILGDFDIRVDGQLMLSGNQRVGWDPQTKQIRAWIFDADGGHMESTWSQLDDRWMVKVTGVTPDGKTGSATNYYVPGKGDQIIWMSTDRVIDGEPGNNIEMKMVRKPPAPGNKHAKDGAAKQAK